MSIEEIKDKVLEQLLDGRTYGNVDIANKLGLNSQEVLNALHLVKNDPLLGHVISDSKGYGDSTIAVSVLPHHLPTLQQFLSTGGFAGSAARKILAVKENLDIQKLLKQHLELAVVEKVDSAIERYENKWKLSDIIAMVAALIALAALLKDCVGK
ncbi:hypothetical protein ACE38W_14870 [Chitinophaga sp. Hz27]|uniref:hypothetical protein n=1 Tax=Chitinophaga sp. Hz27 TaxID=3347169 RepID=UPI0035D7526F